MSVDRLELIRQAAEKTQFKQKVQKKTRKVARNARSGRKSKDSMAAFDEEFMYDDERTTRRVIRESGIVDTFSYTTRFDNEWN